MPCQAEAVNSFIPHKPPWFKRVSFRPNASPQYSLTKNEIAKVKTATDSYNASIASLASSYGYAFVDANSKMKELSQSSGIQFDGVRYTAKFVTGGTFSLDGVHLTGRGYAVIANEFIKAINNKYGSTLPMVNPNGYSGVKFP